MVYREKQQDHSRELCLFNKLHNPWHIPGCRMFTRV